MSSIQDSMEFMKNDHIWTMSLTEFLFLNICPDMLSGFLKLQEKQGRKG